PHVPREPSALPADVADLARPVAGVIGNLALNTDWELVEQVVHGTPFLSWLFVGPTSMPAGGAKQNSARSRLMSMRGRGRFIGERRYGQLRDYARAIDVAVLPYRKIEPTYSGSATRFYEHLAACRPMVGTYGLAELFEKEPLLRLTRDAEQMIHYLNWLRAAEFCDGHEALRWKTSLSETWQGRVSLMMQAFAVRTGGEPNAIEATVH